MIPTPELHTYRVGAAPLPPGLAIAATHYLPRGIRREDYAARGYFDVWVPALAPSRGLLKALQAGAIPFARFARGYRAEMRRPEARHHLQLIAAVAVRQRVNLGCFCADEARCHRSILRELVLAAAAELPRRSAPRATYASPACALPDIED